MQNRVRIRDTALDRQGLIGSAPSVRSFEQTRVRAVGMGGKTLRIRRHPKSDGLVSLYVDRGGHTQCRLRWNG